MSPADGEGRDLRLTCRPDAVVGSYVGFVRVRNSEDGETFQLPARVRVREAEFPDGRVIRLGVVPRGRSCRRSLRVSTDIVTTRLVVGDERESDFVGVENDLRSVTIRALGNGSGSVVSGTVEIDFGKLGKSEVITWCVYFSP
jgi:hypothetical protein